MKIAYLVCFVALLQVSRSDPINRDTNNTSSDLDTATDLEISNINSTDLNSTDSFNVTEDSSTEVSTVASTSDGSDMEADSVSYSTAAEETSSVKEEEPTTVIPSPAHSYAALLQPGVLALVLPVCLRLSSIKLLGVV